MKKLYLSAVSVILALQCMGQAQRLVLTEEFTNASTPGSAYQNPIYNALLDSNTSKIVAIKYHTSWAGADPFNAQNPTEVADRVSYYGVTGVPMSFFNGDTVPLIDPAGVIYTGAPLLHTQEMIDSAYATPSPFSLNLSHNLSADLDSIYINCSVTAAQAFAGFSPSLRLALVEKVVSFSVAPGTNGETEFKNVMRKMIPNANGTSLPATWNNGQSQSFSFALPIPSYIYNPTQIAIVGFVQDDLNFVVHQAAISQPAGITNYASISSASTGLPSLYTCTTNINPTITILNEGTAPLTTAVISYSLDSGNVQTLPFSGSISNGDTLTVSIPAINNLSAGEHTLNFTLLSLNGSNQNSQTYTLSFFVFGNSQPGNAYVQTFASAAFPYANWINISDDTYGFSQNTTAGFGNPKGALKMDFYNSTAGKVDDLILPPFTFSGYNDATLTFKIAAKGYDNNGVHTQDTLAILFSTDCANTWNLAWLKAGPTLATGTTTTLQTAYTATLNNDYRNETVVLPGTGNSSQVLIRFIAISDYGNNAYIDNINITASQVITEVKDYTENSFEVYPNPAGDLVTFSVQTAASQSKLEVLDAVGKLVIAKDIAAKEKQNIRLSTADLNNGVYFVRINGGQTKKLIIQH